MALCLVAVAIGGHVGLYALIASSFFMSIMFPTIFSMSLRGLGVYTKSGSSFLVMAIIGGAVFTAAMGVHLAREHDQRGLCRAGGLLRDRVPVRVEIAARHGAGYAHERRSRAASWGRPGSK